MLSRNQHKGDALVIIPTYNEKENIALLVPAILAESPHFHILIIDDSSPDGTQEVVKQFQAIYPGKISLLVRAGKLGLGTAYIAGFQFALAHNYLYVLTMDADFSHNPADLLKLYQGCKKDNYDMVIGSRYIHGGSTLKWPIARIILSYVANWLARSITGLPIKDVTAGFQCYKQNVLKTIDPQSIQAIGYSFPIEIKFLAWKHGFTLKEIPIVFTNRMRGRSKVSYLLILEALCSIIKLKIYGAFKRSLFMRKPL
jgi:dolichol-phosphate mannosyltransferase